MLVVLLGARLHGSLGVLYQIYFLPVGTGLPFSLKTETGYHQ